MYYVFQQIDNPNGYYPGCVPINKAERIRQRQYDINKMYVTSIGWKIFRIENDGSKTLMNQPRLV